MLRASVENDNNIYESPKSSELNEKNQIKPPLFLTIYTGSIKKSYQQRHDDSDLILKTVETPTPPNTLPLLRYPHIAPYILRGRDGSAQEFFSHTNLMHSIINVPVKR